MSGDAGESEGGREIALLCEMHAGLARLGPGSERTTREALALVPALPAEPLIADLGCGAGASALVLAAATGGTVLALDRQPPFAHELRERAAAAGLGDRVLPLAADMADPPFREAAFDLIWCEGAIYAVGRARALTAWRRLLRPGGTLVFSDAVWLVDERPSEAAAFWAEAYPQMTDPPGVAAELAQWGYRSVGQILLPKEDWTEGYYRPLAANFAAFERRHAADPVALRVLAEQRREMALVERHHGSFAYAVFVAVPVGGEVGGEAGG